MIMKKTRTRQAMEQVKSAQIERATASEYLRQGDRVAAQFHSMAADADECRTKELLTLAALPDIHLGEVIPQPTREDPQSLWCARDTLIEPDAPAVDASLNRINLLSGESHDLCGMAVDAANSVHAGNSLEKMLVHQATMAHEMSMRFGGKALAESDPVESARYANASARLMSAFQQSLLTLQRLRTGGSQTVTVQHVNVGQGGKAVIGNVQAEGGNRGGEQNGK